MDYEGLYEGIIDEWDANGLDMIDEMKHEIYGLFIEFSKIQEKDKINKAAEEYTKIIMELVYETRYEW